MRRISSDCIVFKTSVIKICLIAGFLYWGSGMGRFLHDYFEHWHARPVAVGVERTSASQSNQPSHQSPDPCLICQMLRAMRINGTTPHAALPALGLLTISPWTRPVCPRLISLFLPISARGPPIGAADVQFI